MGGRGEEVVPVYPGEFARVRMDGKLVEW